MPDFIEILDKQTLYQAADTDTIKVVVGGKNTDYFSPSANISFKMQSGEEKYFFNICDDPDQVQTIGKTEVLAGDKLSVRDGDQESTFTLCDTSLKIERVFYTKPTFAPRYKLAFSPGVQFFYQPELTPEEVAGGHIRPDNVVGSYAVYCDRQGHYTRQIITDGYTAEQFVSLNSQVDRGELAFKNNQYLATIANYGCGKIGHLYAPFWTDASGKKIKGTQEIIGNTLTFTLPNQEWIDSAVLPITLDPDLGYTLEGGSYVADNQGVFVTKIGDPGQDGTLDAVKIWIKNADNSSRRIVGVVYTDTGSGAAGALVAESDATWDVSWGTSGAVATLPLLSEAINDGDILWCGLHKESTLTQWAYDDAISGADTDRDKNTTTFPASPDPLVVDGGWTNRRISAYIEYTAGTLLPINCTTGQVVITGIDALISTGTDIQAITGQVVITGIDALISTGTDIQAITGQVVITGIDALISTGTDIQAITGQVVITGIDALISTGTDIQAITGQVVITGIDALISTGTDIQAITGQVVITGIDALISTGTDIQAITGQVVITGIDALISTGTDIETPVNRVIKILAENRVIKILAENRVIKIK